ncbi:MAG: hypothetical protein DSY58_08975 [Desulfobulbus sp.]|nr:MAG: hypothetical protein DSY58_08975 [Desulfobulbus sp.]
MLIIGFVFLGLLLIVLQTTVFMLTPTWAAAPDLYYILIAYLAYRVDLLRGLVILLPLSCILDVFSGTVIGMYPAICYGGYLLLKFVSVKMPVRESLYQIPLVAVSFLVVNWFVFVVMDFIKPGFLVAWSWPLMLLRAGLIVLFSYPLFKCFEFLRHHLLGKFSSLKILRSRSGNQYR